MKFLHNLRRTAAPLLTYALIASVIFAQQPKSGPPVVQPKSASRESAAESNVTLDTLFGADSYAVYGEMRAVGQYVSSEEFKQMLEPLRLPGSMPPEMADLIAFFTTHAETLATARIAFGAMPVADGLPNTVAAVEMPSSEEARKLEPQLRQFVASYYAAHPDVTGDADAARAADAQRPSAGVRTATLGGPSTIHADEGVSSRASVQRAQSQESKTQQQSVRAGERVGPEAAAPYVIKRAGAVVVLADKQFTFRRLRGATDSPALINEPGFAAARARLATDTLFLYFNTTRMGRYTKRQVEEYERREKQLEAEAEAARKQGESYNKTVTSRNGGTVSINVSNSNMNSGASVAPEAMSSNSNVSIVGSSNSNRIDVDDDDDSARDAFAGMSPEERAQAEAAMAHEKEEQAKRKAAPGYAEEQRRQTQQREFETQLGQAVFSGGVGEGAWAESIGVGASLEGDQIVARAFFYSESDASSVRPIPFVPILLSGPPISTEAATVVPKDSDIFISTSLDLPQMYDYVASVFKIFDVAAGASGNTDKLGLFDSQISAFEQQGKFRIKEDLLNSLGNEIGIVLPGDYLGVRRTRKIAEPKSSGPASDAQTKDVQTGTTAPIIVISLKDKKTVEGLLPRALEAAGLKGVGESQLFVKRGDVDVLAFGGGSAAFIGNFLVVSLDPAALDWIIDSYNRGETLANSDEFRRASGWQQRQLLGQVFVSNALLKETFRDVHASVDDIDDPALRSYIARLDPNPGAITYSLMKDGASLFHELHVPKNLLALMSASSIVAQQTAKQRTNELMAMSMLSQLVSGEQSMKEKRGSYVPLEEVPWAFATVSRNGVRAQRPRVPKVDGYDLVLTYSGDKFEINATPNGYPKQGRRSFYVDQTGIVRGGDNGGKPANAESDPVGY
ncbi:MAG: hypothetical protein QOE33_354 [Acidobacteriota bacterium]|nr:hypothetical protein [Acidobacteriota bacterium]